MYRGGESVLEQRQFPNRLTTDRRGEGHPRLPLVVRDVIARVDVVHRRSYSINEEHQTCPLFVRCYHIPVAIMC
jgi:hypothetical protein